MSINKQIDKKNIDLISFLEVDESELELKTVQQDEAVSPETLVQTFIFQHLKLNEEKTEAAISLEASEKDEQDIFVEKFGIN